MKHQESLFFFFAVALTAISCQERLQIEGSTSVPLLEGKTLYLRSFVEDEMITLDSARITHGRFHFTGTAPETTVFAQLFLGGESILPIVLDGKALTITLADDGRKVEGSELNDSLFAFIGRKAEVDRQLMELPRRESQMILNGLDHDEILAQLNEEANELGARNEQMILRFIKDNMDNPLGAGVFMMATANLPYPVMTPQMEELVTLAPESFRNDDYVRFYLKQVEDQEEEYE